MHANSVYKNRGHLSLRYICPRDSLVYGVLAVRLAFGIGTMLNPDAAGATTIPNYWRCYDPYRAYNNLRFILYHTFCEYSHKGSGSPAALDLNPNAFEDLNLRLGDAVNEISLRYNGCSFMWFDSFLILTLDSLIVDSDDEQWSYDNGSEYITELKNSHIPGQLVVGPSVGLQAIFVKLFVALSLMFRNLECIAANTNVVLPPVFMDTVNAAIKRDDIFLARLPPQFETQITRFGGTDPIEMLKFRVASQPRDKSS